MVDPFEILKQSIHSIQEQQGYPNLEVLPDSHLVHDLGFASLDIAQLLAMMEGALGLDPFARGATLDQVTTVKEIADLYRQQVA